MGATGFIANGGTPDNGMQEITAHPAVYRGAVVNVTWAQLEPANGTFDTSAIESALATIAAYNLKYPATAVVGKLRVFAGQNVPSWLFAVAGGPIGVVDDNGNARSIAAFWSSGYKTAWAALQAHLAGIYDGDPRIAETTVGSCSSLTAEPFIAPLNTTSVTAMRQFGFNDTVYKACLSGAAGDYSAWRTTPLDYPFNTYRDSDSNSLVEDPNFTTSVMQSFRAALGLRAVVSNHGLQPTLTAAAMPVYAEISMLGPPIEFQAYGPTVDWDSTIATGLPYHPTEIEIWQTIAAGGSANISQQQLQNYANDLK
jgi:hypothetical protein